MEVEKHTGEVTSMAFGGQGIVRQEGFVVFVPFAATGDTLTYTINQKKKNFAFGEILSVDKPSPHRITPPCPYYGTCGGCQLQHVNYATQLEYKRQWVEEALKRQAGLDISVPAVVPSRLEWSYRRRISLTLKPDPTQHYKAGYIATDHFSLLEVEQCPIFTTSPESIFPIIHEIAGSLACMDRTPAKVTIMKRGDTRFLLHFHFKVLPKNADTIFKRASERHASISGILATSQHKNLQYGQVDTAFDINGLHFTFSPKAFIQTHPDQSQNIYQAVCDLAETLTKGNVLDLYCGIGVSSLLLAKQGFAVTGIEANGAAIQLAKVNAQKNKVSNVRFIKAEVEAVLPEYLSAEKPVLTIVNPPREGMMPEVVQALLKHKSHTIAYISCMPPTLARDLKLLCAKGYRVESVQAYDMFPQTAHVETLVILKIHH